MKINTSILVFLLIGLLVSPFIHSCSDKFELESAKLDTLEIHLDAAEKFLNIDVDLFSFRIEQIQDRLAFLEEHKTDTLSSEYKGNMTKYRGILNIYRKNTENYTTLRDQHETLSNDVLVLRSRLENKELSREEFKNQYFDKEAAIIEMREQAKDLTTSLYSVEPDYNRLTDFSLKEIAVIDSIAGLKKN